MAMYSISAVPSSRIATACPASWTAFRHTRCSGICSFSGTAARRSSTVSFRRATRAARRAVRTICSSCAPDQPSVLTTTSARPPSGDTPEAWKRMIPSELRRPAMGFECAYRGGPACGARRPGAPESSRHRRRQLPRGLRRRRGIPAVLRPPGWSSPGGGGRRSSDPQTHPLRPETGCRAPWSAPRRSTRAWP